LSSPAGVRADPEWTASAVIVKYWPNDAAKPVRLGAGALASVFWPGTEGLAVSGFAMLNHCGHLGGWPPPPRVHFE